MPAHDRQSALPGTDYSTMDATRARDRFHVQGLAASRIGHRAEAHNGPEGVLSGVA
jgi:UDP-glucose 4-epimerase